MLIGPHSFAGWAPPVVKAHFSMGPKYVSQQFEFAVQGDNVGKLLTISSDGNLLKTITCAGTDPASPSADADVVVHCTVSLENGTLRKSCDLVVF